MELDAAVNHHKYIFVDEAGFNLAKTRRRGRNLIGQRATIQVPGQRGGNISMCAAISEDGVVGCRPVLGSYNTEHLIVFFKWTGAGLSGRRHRLCCCVGQCQLPPCTAGSGMVSNTSSLHDPLSSTIFPFPQPNWGILLYMEVEGVWSPSPWACLPSSSHVWSLWWYNCWAMSSLDSSCQEIFPTVPEQRRHPLWCWWKFMAQC